MKNTLAAFTFTLAFALFPATSSRAATTYAVGHINNITMGADTVLIKLDVPLADNCAGTGYGWMLIPATAKTLQAFVLALWARGDLANVTMTVYTDPVVNGYCSVNQIDPVP